MRIWFPFPIFVVVILSTAVLLLKGKRLDEGSGQERNEFQNQTSGIASSKSKAIDKSSKAVDAETGQEKLHNRTKRASGIQPRDCAQVFDAGNRSSGIYKIKTDDGFSFKVYCDMVTDGGGWTVIQRRGDYSKTESNDFYRNWKDYRDGFGRLQEEFWIGNDNLVSLTSQRSYILRIDLWDMDQQRAYAEYSHFGVDDESHGYRLRIGDYRGTAGDGMSYHNGMLFTTKDRDNDMKYDSNCAQLYRGAWWYNACLHSNLNGLNLQGQNNRPNQGIIWYEWKGDSYSLPATEMKIRPQNY